jgi:hypothetical protein
MKIDDAEKMAEEYLLGKEKLGIKEVHVMGTKYAQVEGHWTYVVSGWVKFKDHEEIDDFEVGIDESVKDIRSWRVFPRRPRD